MACECTILSKVRHYSDVHPREALKRAGPQPGGIQCALDKESAHLLFHELTLGGKVTWASKDE